MIQLGVFFKKHKWGIAVAGGLAIAAIAALFLMAGVKTKQEDDQNALMNALGYTQEMLETIQANKTPYVGDNAKDGAIIGQLPVTWKGLSYDSFSLQTKEEPYGLTIQYKETAENSLSDFLDNPFSEAMEENNALLLFAAIENLGEVTFTKLPGMKILTFERGRISGIFGGVPSIDDLDGVYDKLSKNLKMDEFYFSHPGRLWLRTATPEDVIYRNGEPAKIFTNPGGLIVYEYQNSETITIDNATTTNSHLEYYYFKGSELYATRGLGNVADAWERYDDLVARFGQPAIDKNIDGQKYIAYQLRKIEPDEPDKFVWFMIENDRALHSGLMVGDDYTVLNTQANPQ